ncbi:MAG: elongation factor P maturation arginine rhamnosyltransferase EarP [Candidatus Gracilibacteria bacterium]|nr:elongation factor P maturation arginine rhamnosyltransferase EarP [Candidatus Gracilibacteria bacterium]
MNISSLPSIDFYVSVIDNYGDMGFAVNLAHTLHAKYPNTVFRFFSDNEPLFRVFFPNSIPPWVEYLPLEILSRTEGIPTPSRLIYSFFDYKLPKAYLVRFPFPKTIVVFSYFLLHKGLESLHGTTYVLENGYDTVIHFVPSLLPGGGGIILNPQIEQEKKKLLRLPIVEARKQFLEHIDCQNEAEADIYEKKWVSIFVYQDTLAEILPVIVSDQSDAVYWICGNPTGIQETAHCRFLPFLSLVDYGVFLSLCDANIVRGENSLCQALISGKPTLWDIYKESNGAHREKIEDYCHFLKYTFPSVEWGQYFHQMQDFNDGTHASGAFSDFIRYTPEYSAGFDQIGAYIQKRCDLVEKLEK